MPSNSPIKRSFTRAVTVPMCGLVRMSFSQWRVPLCTARSEAGRGRQGSIGPSAGSASGGRARPQIRRTASASAQVRSGERQFHDSPNIGPTTSGEEAGMRTVVVGASSGLGPLHRGWPDQAGSADSAAGTPARAARDGGEGGRPGHRGDRVRRHRHRVVPIGHRPGGREDGRDRRRSSTRPPSARSPHWPTSTPRPGGRSSTPMS